MPFSSSHLDPVSVAIAVASIIFGPALASVIGPYAVILMGSTVGAAWSLGRREKDAQQLRAVWYFLRLNATAVLVTVSLARLTGQWLGIDDPSWLLVPTAIVIGGIGDDWPRIGAWLLQRAGRMFERRTGSGSNSGGNGEGGA